MLILLHWRSDVHVPLSACFSPCSASIFTHASGVTKALALAQAKGGTVWQDLSFCYVNVLAPEVC